MDFSIKYPEFVREHQSTILIVSKLFADDKRTEQELLNDILKELWNEREIIGSKDEHIAFLRIILSECLGPKRKKAKIKFLSTLKESIQIKLDSPKVAVKLIERLRSLSKGERILAFLFFEGIPLDEIASVMGIKTEAIPQKLTQLFNVLKQKDHGKH
ncbi:MAG: sigma-70 family RNA polymerase sigma factor [Alistipes sp.]|nr:sigma-70 family RNA polymerase sigma factor [Candidatus Alistipes equi]